MYEQCTISDVFSVTYDYTYKRISRDIIIYSILLIILPNVNIFCLTLGSTQLLPFQYQVVKFGRQFLLNFSNTQANYIVAHYLQVSFNRFTWARKITMGQVMYNVLRSYTTYDEKRRRIELLNFLLYYFSVSLFHDM